MHPGWVANAHAQAHSAPSLAALNGERRAAGLLMTTPTAAADIDRDSAVVAQPTVENSSINKNDSDEEILPGNHAANDTSDEEMESIHPTYGSVNVSACCPVDIGARRRSIISNVSEISAIDPTTEETLLTERMRARLRYFFMNPLEKWEIRRQFPYKLTLQLVKIVLVTLQLILFGSYRYANVNYTYDNRITFSHLFIKDWDSGREITSYPPNTGPLAVYLKDSFYEYLDHAVNRYFTVANTSIGPYHYHKNSSGVISPIHVVLEEYKIASIVPSNESYVFDTTTVQRTIDIPYMNTSESFSSKKYFEAHNFSINFVTLLEFNVNFSLRTIRFRDLGPLKSPDCFSFEVLLSFSNLDHDGQMLINLDSNPTKFLCKGRATFNVNRAEKFGRSVMNYSVICICTLSLFLCCRAIYRAQQLKAEAVVFFRKYFNNELTIQERLNFLNGWYILIIFNDILIIVGSAVKEQIENKELQSDAWNVCSTCLGVGNLLVWFGVLRYLGFFRTYNVLILTLKRASPNVFRFLICAILIYAGFTFCGWLILGPYHMKFSSLSSTSECLFALINGDDMFATFAAMTNKSPFLWWFCRVYLYTFISLFIYVVLSLFIALIMDAYETIKLFYTEGFPRSSLEEFITGPNDLNSSSSSSYSPGAPQNATFGSHNNTHHNFQHSSCIHQHAPAAGRKISAGGMLDTILENICGCSTPVPQLAKESVSRQLSIRSEETEPLV